MQPQEKMPAIDEKPVSIWEQMAGPEVDCQPGDPLPESPVVTEVEQREPEVEAALLAETVPEGVAEEPLRAEPVGDEVPTTVESKMKTWTLELSGIDSKHADCLDSSGVCARYVGQGGDGTADWTAGFLVKPVADLFRREGRSGEISSTPSSLPSETRWLLFLSEPRFGRFSAYFST